MTTRRRRAPRRGREPRIRLTAADLLRQALANPLSKPVRCLLTMVGTMLGVGLLITTIGITGSARAQINRRFDSLLATEVAAQTSSTKETGFGPAAVERARQLSGVTAAGLIRQLPSTVRVSTSPMAGSASATAAAGASPQVLVASAGALSVIGIHTVSGTSYRAMDEEHRVRAALIGAAAAGTLGITPRSVPKLIYIQGTAFLLDGIIDTVKRHDEFLLSVIIPEVAERELFPTVSAPPELIIATKLGYANAVGAALPVTLNPVEPSTIAITTPPDAGLLRQQVTAAVTGLFVVLAAIGLLIGIVGIANTTIVSVLERVPEIGLRRAIGARRGQIAAQFLLESLILGTTGGLLGGTIGVCAVAGVALANSWSPVIPLWACFAAPAIGALTGILAGAFPAARAARVDPVIALAQ